MSAAGFVLVGGRSTRMGCDKALLRIGNQTFLERTAETVAAATGKVTLIGPPERYPDIKYPIIPDCLESRGPLCGLLTALDNTDADWNLVLACDLPAIHIEFLKNLLHAAESSDAEVVVPQTSGRIEPLCAAYHRSIRDKVAAALTRNDLRMQDFVSTLRTKIVPVDDAAVLKNVNTPEDYSHAQAHYIEFRNVYKTFDRPVLVDVNFHVNAGETVAIIGRSGVGKSVTLSHIMGFLKPDKGNVFASYTDITSFNEAEMRRIRKRVTMVFQSGALFDSLTVGENILFSLELRDDYDAKNKEDVVNGLLQMVDLLEYKDHYPADLSTGYKRAVAIARALAAQPECILYDEPTTMVDPVMSDHLGNLMLRLKTQLQLTGVVVTHDLELLRKVADRVVFLFEGSVIYFGPVADLEKADHPHIQEFLAMDRV